MSENQQPASNDPSSPYNSRNHEQDVSMGRDDALAIASLLGNVTGQLKEIDKQNVGGSNQFTKAAKMDPKQTLKNILTNNTDPNSVSQPVPPPVQQPATPPPQVNNTLPPVQQPVIQPVESVSTDLEKRVNDLEKIVSTYKKIEKFKRGVAYTISTSKIKGTFKDPGDILDIISSELAKQTKSITLKLDVPDKIK